MGNQRLKRFEVPSVSKKAVASSDPGMSLYYSVISAIIRRSIRGIDPGSTAAGRARKVAGHYEELPPGSDQLLANIDRDYACLVKQISSFAGKLERNPISSLNLRFIEGEGIVTGPFGFEFGHGFVGQDQHVLLSTDEVGEWAWTPPEYQEVGTTITPIGCFGFSTWGAVVALRVAHRNGGLRLKLDWFKKSDPAASPIYLVDPVNHQYLFLIESSMNGEVLPGIPRTGILVFQQPDSPTDRLQIHFSGVSVSSNHRKTSFTLEYTDRNLPRTIEDVKSNPSVYQELKAMLDREVSKVRSEILKTLKQ